MVEEVQQQEETPLLDLQKLKAISVLGRGAKGIAFLIRNENKSLALKVISKSSIEKKKNSNSHQNSHNKNKEENNTDLYKRIWFEKDVLNSLDHPLLPKLRGVLLVDDLIGFAIDYCSGGDLNALRKQQTEKMFSNDVIRFYAAELILVLDYLHKLGIIYRDLKPENILIQENGHLMIVDFDLSTKLSSNKVKSNQTPSPGTELKKKNKKNKISRLLLCKSGIPSEANSDEISVVEPSTESVEKSNSFVGTEEYVAPEIILGDGHDFSVDWWSLGVVLYEMLYGHTPFRGINRKETFYRILSKSPELVGEQTELRDLIGKLLEKDPAKRISVEEIKGHDYFNGVNWDTVLEISRPPNIPPTKWDDDIDLEEMEGLDVQLVAGGLFEEDKVRKEKKNKENVERKDNNIWVEGLKHPAPDNEFLIF